LTTALMPDLPGHQRRHERRLERTLDDDLPGAPPGFLLDEDDDRTGSHTEGDETGCAEEVARMFWDQSGDPLARGEGERREG
jgi:hypothetical protein